MAPERPTSPQDEITKMSVPGSPVAGTPIRDAQSPISILLAVAQSQNRTDDDLTNLNWLHSKDLLKGIVTKNKYLLSGVQGMNINPSPSTSVNLTSTNDSQSMALSPIIEYEDSSHSDFLAIQPVYVPNQQGVLKQSKHPHNIPYDPQIHTNNKPPYSFSCLIFMAIEDSAQKALPVKEIYAWILEHFPYFKNAPTGWKNSVRHNLSLNKCFQKVEKAPNLGKGSLWTVDPQYKPNLIQALSRSPFHPRSIPEQTSTNCRSPIAEKSPSHRLPNPELFPYLAKKLAATKVKIEPKNENALADVDAAAVMLSLKNSSTQRSEKNVQQIITTSPSQDHTYSAADNVDIFDRRAKTENNERALKSRIVQEVGIEDDEERKLKEGAETLLNLAGITMRKRTNSSSYIYEDSLKKIKIEYDINENVNNTEEKPVHFKPRLLRGKNKEYCSKVIYNNNNEDDWVKHRRALEGKQHR